MKKSLGLLVLSVILLTSCQTMVKTARTADMPSSLKSVTVADLKVADQRITYTMSPDKQTRRGGLNNIQKTAEHEALKNNGNADVLLDLIYVISKRKGLFGSKITSITVSGRPAYYTNYRVLHDSVWCNPAFRGIKTNRSGSILSSENQKKDRAVFAGDYFRKRGFTKHFTLTGIHSKLELADGRGRSDESFAANALLSLGHQFNPHFYLGAGTGVVYVEEADLGFVPLFANARGYLSKSRKTFFCDLKLGYYVPVCIGDSDADWEGEMYRSFAIGYSFGKFDVSIEAAKHDFYFSSNYDEIDLELSTIGLSFGFRF